MKHNHHYIPTIGIEIHVQLKTISKIFCSCANQFGQEPNKNICVVCTGQPGSLPVINKKVIDYAIKAGLATNCTINKRTTFARKHYMYPDLPKNYQITQGDYPICKDGYIIIFTDKGEKKVHLERIHMEEDAGKNVHTEDGVSLVNLNRAGTPLLEIVSKPDMGSAQEAHAYLTQIHKIVQYLGISDANMEEGSFRADINISIRSSEDSELGKKVELKNINSFKFITHAIDHEIERQIKLKEEGSAIYQETRLWDAKKQESIFMRSKEGAQDYRYCRDPDLPAIIISDEWITQIKKNIPELPRAKKMRFESDYKLSSDDAHTLTTDPLLASFFEKTVAICNNPKLTCNWILRNLLGHMKEHKVSLSNQKVTPEILADLIKALEAGLINSSAAQEIFNDAAVSGKSISTIIDEKDLKQLDDVQALSEIIDDILAKNTASVEKYKNGQTKLFMFFVGQVMKETKGKGNPKVIQGILENKLT